MEILFGTICLGWLPICISMMGVMAIKSPNSFRKYYFLYAIAFGMISYCYEPTYEIDLSRYFAQLEICRHLPITQAMTWTNDGLVVKNLLFWLISRVGDNHILPLLSMTIIFGVSTYISVDSTKKSNIKLYRILLFQLMLIPFYNTLSNVRNVVAFALIILAIYRDLVYKKRNLTTTLLYLLPCFIHMAGLAMLLIRLSLIIVKKMPYLGFALTLGIPTASIALFERVGKVELPGNFGKIVSRAIWKSYSSSVNTSDYAVTMRESGYFTACRFVMFLVCGILLIMLIRQLRSDTTKYRDYKVFCGIIIAITMIWIVLGTVKYWVFAFAVVVSASPILVAFYEDSKYYRKFWPQVASLLLCLLMIARFALEIYFISKRIVVSDYLTNALGCSAWVILAKSLIHIVTG